MDRISNIIKTSAELRRRIWASLPFSLRLADFFSRVALSTADVFGKAVYGEFLAHGITEGMPDIFGQPAAEFDVSKKPVANRLPFGYGKEFGKKAFHVLLRKMHRPDLVEEIMSDFLVRFIASGAAHLDPTVDRVKAENYVLKGLMREAYNMVRDFELKRKLEVSENIFQEGEESRKREFPVYDEDTVEKLVKRMLPRLQTPLKRIHPDAPKYVELSLIEGYTDTEIIGDVEHGIPSLLSNPYTPHGNPLNQRNWDMVYKDKIMEVLKKSFRYLQDRA